MYKIEKNIDDNFFNSVCDYWGKHTVKVPDLQNVQKSLNHINFRFRRYPLFREFSGIYSDHSGEIILDYGCGPGNDVLGFSLYSNPKKIIGVDVSEKALNFAVRRLRLHNINPEKVTFILNKQKEIPLDDNSVDHINCQGVLHHVENPIFILNEFYRILKPSGKGCIMVYNRDSLCFNFFIAYYKMFIKNVFKKVIPIEEAFRQSTDGVNCPISVAYSPDTFSKMLKGCGFNVDFIGGYLSKSDNLKLFNKFKKRALGEKRLDELHKNFMRSISVNERGFPVFNGKVCGVGGVYKIIKSE